MSDDSTVKGLFFYPIKGLSPVPLDSVDLTRGQGFPHDRMFGFARADSGFDPENPKPLPKTKFLVLAQEAALASLTTRFDPATRALTIATDGTTLDFDLATAEGCAKATAFLSGHLGLDPAEMPDFVSAAPHRFTDVSVVSDQMMHAVSLLNLESLRALEQKTGVQIDPGRFRANILLDGWPAFSELDLIDKTIRIGDVQMKVIFHTRRCAATEVNLNTATRDLEIPKLLHRHFGHMNMGVYAEVLSDGPLKIGAPVVIE